MFFLDNPPRNPNTKNGAFFQPCVKYDCRPNRMPRDEYKQFWADVSKARKELRTKSYYQYKADSDRARDKLNEYLGKEIFETTEVMPL